ncbi:hypothetical protein [Aquimarina sp. RZ0]|uniref:hypothetical protein n=1 Tax=Aquimarina sp. RZ0 TaxID=2607730 RepID=UPI0011F1CCC3|nr:hypothetical protein [Aquimarina sp. RZ0]KAA1247892.1 hypothetical protein F0000_01350 [Aquimarina sp. RZ0]
MKTLKPSFKIKFLFLFSICLSFITTANTIDDRQGLEMAIFNSIYNKKYDLVIPKNITDKKLPLYIVLPGGLGTKNYTKFRDSLILPGLKNKKGIVFSPKISWKRTNQKALENIIVDFITVARKTFSIDTEKITLIGYSNGAIQATKLGKSKSFLFSSIVLMASNFKFSSKIKTPIYIIQGTKDRYFPIKKAYKSVSYAKEIGCDITFIVAEGKNDYNPSQYKSELKDLTTWLENTIWNPVL